MRDTTFRANDASDDDESGSGAGIFNQGIADIRRSLFTQHYLVYSGYGAAIMNANGGILKLVSSTISDNAAGGQNGRGAIANGSPYIAPGKLYLTNVTIADNAYFGLYTRGDTYINNSIIAGNALPENGLSQNCFREGGEYVVHDLLLGDGDNLNCWTTHHFQNSKTFSSLLDALADNGGPTLTHALRKGSFAIDRSSGSLCSKTDQRGQLTQIDGNNDGVAVCDLGAVEYHP